MKRKLAEEITNSEECNEEIRNETTSDNVASSSIDAGTSTNCAPPIKEEGAAKRKRGRPRKTEAVSALSLSAVPNSSTNAVENGKRIPNKTSDESERINLPVLPGFIKEQKSEDRDEQPIVESVHAKVMSEPAGSLAGVEEEDEEVTIVDDDPLKLMSHNERSVIVKPSSSLERMSLINNSGNVMANDGSFEDFTQLTRFRTAQIIVRGRSLFVNPYALIEYSDVVANVVEKSGRSCKIQLDFMNFDDLQTALRVFCRSPITGLKERLNDPNSAIAKKKCGALRSCSILISVLKDVVECDDIPDTSNELGLKENEALGEWYVPSKYRTFELIPADAQAVFVNMEMIKEYSTVLADSPAIFSDYCMLPQFTSSELITALNVLFRSPRTGRFHSVTLENMETLYKCAGLFECLRPMCDAFSKDVSVDAVIKADWYRLKSILQVQASRRKCGEPNRLLLTDILSTTADLLRDTPHILERLQRAGLAEIPMGIGIALMVAVTEARTGSDNSEAMRLIL